MKIEKSKLTERLAEKSGLAPDEAEKHLKELIEQIQETAQKGKALEVKGLGLFYRSEDQELVFEPADEFATEVNYQYAGMEPVEVGTGKSSPGQSVAKKEPYDIANAGKSSGESVKKGTKPSDKSGKGNASERGGEKTKKEKKPASGQKTASIQSPGSRRRVAKSGKDPIMNLVYTVITIAVLAVTLIYVLDLNETGPGPEPAVSEETTTSGEQVDSGPEQPVQPESSPNEPAEPSSEQVGTEGSIEGRSNEEAEETSAEELAASQYGLMGETIELEERYYTIVLHSMSQKLRAEEEAGRLRENGYRDVLYRVDSEDHGTMWRVGVGQFETIDAAQQAAQELDKPFFIGRIQ